MTWNILCIESNREPVAERYLSQAGHEVYCPRYQRLSRRRGKPEGRIQPLWPGYMLIREPEDWREVLDTTAVYGVLCRAGEAFKPFAMADCEVAVWKTAGPVMQFRTKRPPKFIRDQIAKVVNPDNAFWGHNDLRIVTEDPDRQIVTAVKRMFGKDVPIVFGVHELEAVI